MVQGGRTEKGGNASWRLRSHVEDLLDEALMETFPASDPVAICFEEVELTARRSDGRAPRKGQNAPSPDARWRY